MFFRPRRPARRLARRFARPAVAALLVLAQAVTAFGFPVVTRTGRPTNCGGGACGCGAAGHAEACGCGPTGCTAPLSAPPPEPTCGACGNAPGSCCHTKQQPAPETDACPKCRSMQPEPEPPLPAAKPAPAVKWVIGMKARQCRGDGPLGLFADLPSVPPAAAESVADPTPFDHVPLTDLRSTATSSVPLDPPPRCG